MRTRAAILTIFVPLIVQLSTVKVTGGRFSVVRGTGGARCAWKESTEREEDPLPSCRLTRSVSGASPLRYAFAILACSPSGVTPQFEDENRADQAFREPPFRPPRSHVVQRSPDSVRD